MYFRVSDGDSGDIHPTLPTILSEKKAENQRVQRGISIISITYGS